MNRKARVFCFLVVALGALVGCSSEPAKEAKKAAAPLDKIQGKAQVLIESGGATDAALNGGGKSSVYIWEGLRRYRLFLKTPVEVTHGDEYIVEGVDAQKVIDEIGDPDMGKNGYPLESSCRRAVTTAWPKLSFDDIDATVALVRTRVNRYPARPLLLVTRIEPVTSGSTTADAKKKADAEKNIRAVTVAADKQKASLIEGPTVLPAPLWEPKGGTVKCSVVIDTEGKVSELQTGVQLCEAVPWAKFRYQPPVQGGKPVKVSTDVEVSFEPRKAQQGGGA